MQYAYDKLSMNKRNQNTQKGLKTVLVAQLCPNLDYKAFKRVYVCIFICIYFTNVMYIYIHKRLYVYIYIHTHIILKVFIYIKIYLCKTVYEKREVKIFRCNLGL